MFFMAEVDPNYPNKFGTTCTFNIIHLNRATPGYFRGYNVGLSVKRFLIRASLGEATLATLTRRKATSIEPPNHWTSEPPNQWTSEPVNHAVISWRTEPLTGRGPEKPQRWLRNVKFVRVVSFCVLFHVSCELLGHQRAALVIFAVIIIISGPNIVIIIIIIIISMVYCGCIFNFV